MTTSITKYLYTQLSTGFSFLTSRRLIAISGPDSTGYLQGAVTGNMSLCTTKGIYTAFLTAQGRVLNDVFIYPFNEEEGKYKGEPSWLIEVDAEEVENLAQRIRRYRLSSRFSIRVLAQAEKGVWSIWDDGAKNLQSSSSLVSRIDKAHRKEATYLLDQRTPTMGHRLLLPGNKKPDLEMDECHENYYKLRRYLRGVPEGQSEILKEQALPQESNIDFMGGIDYRKGCYVGQELTIRTHHIGVVRKRILPLQLYSEDDKMPQELTYRCEKVFGVEKIPINTSIEWWQKPGKSTGKWLAGLGNIGLGLCRLADMTAMKNKDMQDNCQATDEFKVKWEADEGIKIVKVKAFTPSWHNQTTKT